MDNRQYVNQIVTNRVEHTERKPRQHCTTNARNDFRIQLRRLLESFKLQFDSGQELFAQTAALRLVPIVRLAHLTQRTSRKLYAIRHVPSRRRDLTCSHE